MATNSLSHGSRRSKGVTLRLIRFPDSVIFNNAFARFTASTRLRLSLATRYNSLCSASLKDQSEIVSDLSIACLPLFLHICFINPNYPLSPLVQVNCRLTH